MRSDKKMTGKYILKQIRMTTETEATSNSPVSWAYWSKHYWCIHLY